MRKSMEKPRDDIKIVMIPSQQEITQQLMPWQKHLLATKFYVPTAPGPLVSRSRLTSLLNESLKYPLVLISAPAGFGKTTLLSSWVHSLTAKNFHLAWVSLDEEDNDPWLFCSYMLSAFDQQQPGYFAPLLTSLQSSQAPPLKYVLAALINLLAESREHFVLILDDYQLITEPQIHTALVYLIEHCPSPLHIVIATRTDPPFSLPHLRARQRMLEIRTPQLRCTAEETKVFFQDVMSIELPEETIQEVMVRTEGWLVGLQLLGLSLPKQTSPLTFLKETIGDQRYILDYLTEEVLQRQPPDVQTFLLSTCILERVSASLGDAVIQQQGSQQILERLEQANLFIVSLDSRRQWYRYHALFAEALSYQLEQMHPDQVPLLHYRASLWYAEHDQTILAIIHAFRAAHWQWAADLIERKVHLLMSQAWGASQHELVMFRQWLKQLPAEVVNARPRLCVACALLLWQVAPQPIVEAWLDTAEAMLTSSSTGQRPDSSTVPMVAKEDQADLLAEELAWRAFLRCHVRDGHIALSLCQQALTLLSQENYHVRAIVEWVRFRTLYISSANDAAAAIESGLQASSLAQTAGLRALAIVILGTTTAYMVGTGQLREALRLTQQAMQWARTTRELMGPYVGYPALFQADILREWNQLDGLPTFVAEGIELCKQTESMSLLIHLIYGYGILLRVHLTGGALNEACTALQEIEHIGRGMNQHLYLHVRSIFTTVDQVRLWLACGELDRAMFWVKDLDRGEKLGTPFEHERQTVARARIFLAQEQPTLALEQLDAAVQRATAGRRWGHIIEMRLLQALAHQMLQEKSHALSTLSEAVRLAEPEGYIRSFVDEGAPVAMLLSTLRQEQGKQGPTPYLDTVLAAFEQKSMIPKGRVQAQVLSEPLSERERQVLQLLVKGASNQEIAQALVITIDTVKRHVSHIFAKLDVQNRVQAVRRAQELSLFEEQY